MAVANPDNDAVNDALNAFAERPVKEIPEELEKLLSSIATTGRATYPWGKVKLLLVQKLENVIEEYLKENPDENVPLLPNVENVSFADMKQRLLTNINKFKDAPFTIQRICELLVSPKKYYMQRDKFMRGIEKNILIVTTVTPTGKRITSVFEGSHGPTMVNGILPSESNIPNGTQPIETQFKVPSSPGDARQQPSSSGEISSREPPHTDPSAEPSPKRIRLQDLPDQARESPSTSDDRLPPSEAETPLNDGVSSIDDASTSAGAGSNVDLVLNDGVSSNEGAATNVGNSNQGMTSKGDVSSNNVVSSDGDPGASDSVFTNDDGINLSNNVFSNNEVTSNGDMVSNYDSAKDGVRPNDDSSNNVVTSNDDEATTNKSRVAPDESAVTLVDHRFTSSGDGINSSSDVDSNVSERSTVRESARDEVGDSSSAVASSATQPLLSDECKSESDSLSSQSEAMETDATTTTQRLEDQSNLSEVQTGVESSSEVGSGPVSMEEGAVDSGTDESMHSGTEDARGQSSEEEMEVQSSTQVTESPAPPEETNEAVAAEQKEEGDGRV